jgi:hypothetical protein
MKGQMRESKLGDLIMRFDYPMSSVQTPKALLQNTLLLYQAYSSEGTRSWYFSSYYS